LAWVSSTPSPSASPTTLAQNTAAMSGTISCSAPVVSMTMTVVVSVMRVAPAMNEAAPTTE